MIRIFAVIAFAVLTLSFVGHEVNSNMEPLTVASPPVPQQVPACNGKAGYVVCTNQFPCMCFNEGWYFQLYSANASNQQPCKFFFNISGGMDSNCPAGSWRISKEVNFNCRDFGEPDCDPQGDPQESDFEPWSNFDPNSTYQSSTINIKCGKMRYLEIVIGDCTWKGWLYCCTQSSY